MLIQNFFLVLVDESMRLSRNAFVKMWIMDLEAYVGWLLFSFRKIEFTNPRRKQLLNQVLKRKCSIYSSLCVSLSHTRACTLSTGKQCVLVVLNWCQSKFMFIINHITSLKLNFPRLVHCRWRQIVG